LLFVKNLYKIQSHIIKEKPDFIIVASHIPITYILPFLYKRKTKIIKEIHYTQFYRIKREKNLKQKFFKYVESKYNALIVLSQEEKSFYKTKNVVVIPNPTIISLKPKNIVKKDNIATTIARFAPVKRLELLIDIWKELIKKQVNWQLHIYGNADNDYGKKIKDLIDKSQLQESVILKGMTNQVNEVLNKSKVSLLVSEQECFPMIILESFAVGVPVISFDCPTGPRNIITDKKDGLLIENNQIDDFVSIFEKFSKDLSLQKSLSANALLSADKYKVEKVMNEWQTKIFN
jgi:glycosyltransferase involved in cell wall biosynthesis